MTLGTRLAPAVRAPARFPPAAGLGVTVRILIDSGSYHALNAGDVAMLQAALERFSILWPRATVSVITNAPRALVAGCPGITPIPLSGRVAWVTNRVLGRMEQRLPASTQALLATVEERLRAQWPMLSSTLIAVKHAVALRGGWTAPIRYIQALRRADLVVGTGAGVFTDAFAENALGVLTTIELAQRRGTPTALLGQGFGPVSDPVLLARMAVVLPRVDLISVREPTESVRLLRCLGVPADRIVVTGDDAIEMVHQRARPELGSAIGVNVRVAGYAGTNAEMIERLRPAIHHAAGLRAAPLVPIPIAHHPDCHDGVAIREVVSGHDRSAAVPHLMNPAAAMSEVSRCRVVVTGSYHAAVFALGQGIPVVALVASPYYAQKFAGVADLFPGGCRTIALDGGQIRQRIEQAIVHAWDDAPNVRESLLQSASRQIDRGREAYRRLHALVTRAAAPRRVEIDEPRQDLAPSRVE